MRRKRLTKQLANWSVLERHIQSQPYLELALRPVRKHPKTSIIALLIGICTLGLALSLSSPAGTKDVGLEILGSIEELGAEPRSVRRFSSRLDLDEEGHGVHEIAAGDKETVWSPKHFKPHRIEVVVLKNEGSSGSFSTVDYAIGLRILREGEGSDIVVSEPSLLTSMNSITNLDFTSDDGVRYSLTLRVVPKDEGMN